MCEKITDVESGLEKELKRKTAGVLKNEGTGNERGLNQEASQRKENCWRENGDKKGSVSQEPAEEGTRLRRCR